MQREFLRFQKERRTKPFLLLEIGISTLRLHEVDAGKDPIKVIQLREEALTPNDISMLIEKIRAILDSGCATQEIAIVMKSPVIHHQVLCIPPMKKAERQKIISMEMKHAAISKDVLTVSSFWSAGKIKDQEATKEYILCAELPSSLTEELIAVVREKKLNLIGITSYAQAASHLLKECPLENKANIALVDITQREGSVTLFHAKIWNMERHFVIGPNLLSENDSSADIDIDKLKLEVGRALQYFKQQVRNENISQIFLFGSSDYAGEICRLLESAFRIPVLPLPLDAHKFKTGENKEDIQPLLRIPHSIALHARFQDYIDFMPSGSHGQKPVHLGKITLALSATVFYALLGGICYLYTQEAASIKSEEQNNSSMRPTEPSQGEHLQQLINQRSFALATDESMRWLHMHHSVLADLARELAATIPPEMRITTLQAHPMGDGWKIEFSAEIKSPSGSASRQLFLQFQKKVDHLTCLKQLSWEEINIQDTESSESPNRNSLTFDMRGVINSAGRV